VWLTLYFCTAVSAGACISMHPLPRALGEMMCETAGPIMAEGWVKRNPGWIVLGFSCDPVLTHLHNERPWRE